MYFHWNGSKRVKVALNFIESKSFKTPQILEDYCNENFQIIYLG